MIETATKYAARGWRVLPLHGRASDGSCTCGSSTCSSPAKHPRNHDGSKGATLDLEQIARWWRQWWPDASIGIATGNGLVVVDYDPRHDPDGVGKAWCDALPATYTVRTGGGGMHYYFADTTATRRPGDRVKNARGIVPGVDVRGDGGYVVAPPSVHASGARYEVAHDVDMAPLPPLPAAPSKGGARPIESARSAGPTRTRDPVARARAWLRKRDPAISGQGGHDYTMGTLALVAGTFGLDAGQIVDAAAEWAARCEPPWSRAEIEHKAKDAVSSHVAARVSSEIAAPAIALPPRGVDLLRGPRGPMRGVENIARCLRGHPDWTGRIVYDELAVEPRIDGRSWTDDHTTHVRTWVERTHGWSPTPGDVDAAVAMVARERSVHPLRDMLRATPWDGTPRLHDAAERYLGATRPIEQIYLRAWLLSAVARALVPGTKADAAIVLEGAQGARKSTAVRVMARDDRYFTDALSDFVSKDAAMSLFGRWIVEIAELVAMHSRGADVEHAKAFLSRSVDKIRLPWARRSTEHPRTCVFAATTNSYHYLRDATGNRRWWPISVGAIDIDGLRRDMPQLHAEAVACIDAGEPHYLHPDEDAHASEHTSEREDQDPWHEMVARSARRQASVSIGAMLTEIGVRVEHQGPRESARVGAILRREGYAPHRVDGARIWTRARVHDDRDSVKD